MDDIVLRGMAKWPNVPSVYGWLALDRRGNWLIKGERIANAVVSAFIGRNYEHDVDGRWFFQNGPQRVFVTLGYTPFIYRIVSPHDAPLAIEAHNGKPVSTVSGVWIDENGAVLLQTEHGVGVVHDRDLDRLLTAFIHAGGSPLAESMLDELMERVRRGRAVPLWLRFGDASVKIEPIRSESLPQRFGFVSRPVQPAGREECY
ncbi:MAG: DUF2946 family protein [Betaproteobacteria bacterium]|nr:DUF2946 family protein [Betaproteobacteria bacterium]